MFISGNGLAGEEEKSAQLEKDQVASKIPILKNGFSNAYLDTDGSIWFSSNGGGIFHYNGKAISTKRKKTD